MGNAVKQLLEFGPFRLDPEQRLLLRAQTPIPLSPKAFDLLLILVQRSGEVVVKDDLMKLLWPDTFVEESNLGQHVFQLRKALGDRSQGSSYIVTVPRPGLPLCPAGASTGGTGHRRGAEPQPHSIGYRRKNSSAHQRHCLPVFEPAQALDVGSVGDCSGGCDGIRLQAPGSQIDCKRYDGAGGLCQQH